MSSRRYGLGSYFNKCPGKNIIIWSGYEHPTFNEIFALTQPKHGIYELRPFEDFNLVIEGVDNEFKLNTSGNRNNQRFYVECDICNPHKNSMDWIQYYTSCLIKNVASGLCMNNNDGKVTQTDCAIAPKWAIWGRASTNITYPACPACPACPTCSTYGLVILVIVIALILVFVFRRYNNFHVNSPIQI
ncbi:hypothetical protein C1645_255924 [Glomus cerebriforme]|uniref:Uncharacterized protein n=1 Tax=Glomus cerebriforme TaxID=658196 RepID=A0A397SZ34_9GLOM|nr:hypothetical protein C1645_255924 [Glomus cerebriforme]